MDDAPPPPQPPPPTSGRPPLSARRSMSLDGNPSGANASSTRGPPIRQVVGFHVEGVAASPADNRQGLLSHAADPSAESGGARVSSSPNPVLIPPTFNTVVRTESEPVRAVGREEEKSEREIARRRSDQRKTGGEKLTKNSKKPFSSPGALGPRLRDLGARFPARRGCCRIAADAAAAAAAAAGPAAAAANAESFIRRRSAALGRRRPGGRGPPGGDGGARALAAPGPLAAAAAPRRRRGGGLRRGDDGGGDGLRFSRGFCSPCSAAVVVGLVAALFCFCRGGSGSGPFLRWVRRSLPRQQEDFRGSCCFGGRRRRRELQGGLVRERRRDEQRERRRRRREAAASETAAAAEPKGFFQRELCREAAAAAPARRRQGGRQRQNGREGSRRRQGLCSRRRRWRPFLRRCSSSSSSRRPREEERRLHLRSPPAAQDELARVRPGRGGCREERHG
jgi:hypothetical protein